MKDVLSQPLALPCGARLHNRLAKAAMTEGVADDLLRATPRHETLYRRWSEGGTGLLLTGNVQVDRTDLERPGNVALDVTEPREESQRARDMAERFGIERLLLNSSGDWEWSDPLAVPKCARLMLQTGFTRKQVNQAVWHNPYQFLAQGTNFKKIMEPAYTEEE